MNFTLYQIDAFASKCFEGNPAAVCPLDKWLPDETLQAIALENNLSETAYFVPENSGFHIRWFTPTHEVKLCGHATLASAYVLFNLLKYSGDMITFNSQSGLLNVHRKGDWLEMDFPAQPPEPCEIPSQIIEAFQHKPSACLRAEDYIVVFDTQEQVAEAAPDLATLSKLDLRGVCITAPGRQHDIVVRFFAPRYGINEDPVTGSAYTQLVPYWSQRLGKQTLQARQISQRGGDVNCELRGERVAIAGKAVKYLEGIINIS